LEEHTLQVPNGDYIPAWEILPAVQNQPLLVLSGLYTETRLLQPSPRTRFAWWIIALAIFIIFSAIQYSLVQAVFDLAQSFLLLLSLLIELGVFYLWSKYGFRLFNRRGLP
jgi:hypothetical protein